MRVHRVFMSFAISIGLRHPPSQKCGVFRKSIEEPRKQQMACTPDVWRLCGAQIPDADRIVGVLAAKYCTTQRTMPCGVIEPTAKLAQTFRDDQPLNNRRNPKKLYRAMRDRFANLRGKKISDEKVRNLKFGPILKLFSAVLKKIDDPDKLEEFFLVSLSRMKCFH